MQSFPGGGRRIPVSIGGRSTPRWKHDGSELFHVSPVSQLMSFSVAQHGDEVTIGRPVPLFQSRAFWRLPEYDVAPGGPRLLVTLPLSDLQDNSVTVIVNWPATLKP